jgi:hypothetical protein
MKSAALLDLTLVDQYLNNEFGDAAKLDPRIASLFFACDRFEA